MGSRMLATLDKKWTKIGQKVNRNFVFLIFPKLPNPALQTPSMLRVIIIRNKLVCFATGENFI